MKLKVFYATLLFSILAISYALGRIQLDFNDLSASNEKYILAKEVRESFLTTQTNFRGFALYGNIEFKHNTREGYRDLNKHVQRLEELAYRDNDKELISLTNQTKSYSYQWFSLAEQGFIREIKLSSFGYIKYLKTTLKKAQKIRYNIQDSTFKIEKKEQIEVEALQKDIEVRNRYLIYLIFFGTLSSVLSAMAVGTEVKRLQVQNERKNSSY